MNIVAVIIALILAVVVYIVLAAILTFAHGALVAGLVALLVFCAIAFGGRHVHW